jgi:hypothetical protein
MVFCDRAATLAFADGVPVLEFPAPSRRPAFPVTLGLLTKVDVF